MQVKTIENNDMYKPSIKSDRVIKAQKKVIDHPESSKVTFRKFKAENNHQLCAIGKENAKSPQDLLLEAIFDNSSEGIRNAIKQGAIINQKDMDGRTPLVIAVLTNKTTAIIELIQMGADAKIKYNNESMVIHALRGKNNLKLATMLLNAGADFYGCLHFNYDNVMQHAINQYMRPSRPNTFDDANNFLHTLLQKGYPIHGNDWINNVFYMMLKTNAWDKEKTEAIINIFASRGANVNQIIDTSGLMGRGCDTTSLILAIEASNKDAVALLLMLGADPNLKGHKLPALGGAISPLIAAMQLGQPEIIELLMRHGAKA